MLALLAISSQAFAGDAFADTVPELRVFLTAAPEREQVAKYLEGELKHAFPGDPKLQAQVLENIAQNLADKQSLPLFDGKSFPLTADELKRVVIDYEIFKMKTYLSAGVFPKRYFGYFDERWDTAPRERVLREVTHTAVKLINEAQQKKNSATRVSDIEVAVTFIAEGGALLLREHQAQLDDVHPVYGVGLDDIAKGLRLYRELAMQFDKELGTGLQQIVSWDTAGRAYLTRNMHFKEAILGTALMYIYEKELAAKKLKETEATSIEQLSLDEQFIVGSLVYNSGLTFTAKSRASIKSFATGDQLNFISTRNVKRLGLLPVLAPSIALNRVRAGDGYPDQPTSWSGMYHVLQRYGGYQALRRFTTVFDEAGMYKQGAAP